MNPLVSVIMSVHNGAVYLQEAIDSILAQTFRDFEFVIVNDASSDDSSNILETYRQADARVRILTNETNIGLTKSLNRAIAVSTGMYIARMDADDIAYLDRFAAEVDFLQQHLDYGVVGTWAHVIDAKGAIVDEFAWETDNQTIKKHMIKWNPIIHSSVMICRSVLAQSGVYDETLRYAQDYDLWLRMIRYTKFATIPRYALKYRIAATSITASKNRAQAWCALRARWRAIRAGQYPFTATIYLMRPMVSMILPRWLRGGLKKLYL